MVTKLIRLLFFLRPPTSKSDFSNALIDVPVILIEIPCGIPLRKSPYIWTSSGISEMIGFHLFFNYDFKRKLEALILFLPETRVSLRPEATFRRKLMFP